MLLKEGKKDALVYRIYDSREAMGRAAAADAAAEMRRLLREKEEINVIFAAAPSQNEMLAALVREDLPWQRINGFHMDEYTHLPEQAPQTFGNFLRRAIFSRVSFRSVHYIHGENGAAECRRYGKLLEQYPADVVCLGIGENGHIAFNDPDTADFDDPVPMKEVLLDPACRAQQVHDGCFPDLESVPRSALTLTVPALTRASVMICTVPGLTKAPAVKKTLQEPVSTACPAGILRRHGCARLYCDRDSGSALQEE